MNAKTLLKRGSRGADVKTLQEALNSRFGDGLTVDGIFGRLTEEAVKNAQERLNLKVDGKAGVQTLTALNLIPDETATIENIKQFDKPHGPKVYGGKGYTTYADAGCGPTSATIIIRAFYNPDCTVEEIGDYLYEHGYRVKGKGTSSAGFRKIFTELYPCSKYVVSSNYSEAKKCLDAGGLVICHFANKKWHNAYAGHYVVLYAVDDSTAYIRDVGSTKTIRQSGTITMLKSATTQYYCVYP